LTEAFREYTDKKQYCAIGSVKGNIGHLDAAAGIAAIIKAALCVNKGILVPSINFSEPNPALKLDSSPFYVSQNCSSWPENFEVRRAGVSSFGVGGTNVHIIIEQPPVIKEKEVEKRPYVVTVSSLSQQNLQVQKKQLADYINANSNINLADIEFTTIYGRKTMPYRFSVVSNDKNELINQLNGVQKELCYEGYSTGISESIFMFPGQGSQYATMTAELYQKTETFKNDMDFCFDYLKTLSGINFKEIIFSNDSQLLNRTENTQIALFIVEYCLAKELLRTGIRPNAIIGHSMGEYTAACIVGCITIEDALKLVFHRGKLMGSMPEGDMILVRATEQDLQTLLINSVSICAYNADDNIVIGGTRADVDQQSKILELNNIEYKKLKVSHAYHTKMMDNALAAYDEIVSQVKFKTFDTMVFSTYTGDVVEPEVFCSKEYWMNQIINPVKFSQAVKNSVPYFANPVFIEIGPGNGLSSFVKSIFNHEVSTVNLLSKLSVTDNSLTSFHEAKATLYAKGITYNLPEVHKGKRVPLPGYVFSKNRFWKPKVNISFNDFQEVKDGYHFNSEQYTNDRLRTSIEIQLTGHKVSGEVLNSLNDLNTQYINDIKKLFSSEEKVRDRVEVLFNELVLNNETSIQDEVTFNHKRNVSSLFVEPETATEKSIAEYWGNVLGYWPVGTQDNYFEVGGNSLLATKLLTQLSDEFEITLSFRDLSEYASVKELAAFIESKKRTLDLIEVIEVESDINNNYIEI
ncbi:MAG: acyltransferase domain-containing protein, partial [Flavobacterium sp.]